MKVGSIAWDVWIHALSCRFLGSDSDFEGFHGCIAMLFLLNNTWWWILLDARFFSLKEVFPGYILYHNFCGYFVYSPRYRF